MKEQVYPAAEIKILKLCNELRSEVISNQNRVLYLINNHAGNTNKLLRDSVTPMENDDDKYTITKEDLQKVLNMIQAMSDERYYNDIRSYITASYITPTKRNIEIINKL